MMLCTEIPERRTVDSAQRYEAWRQFRYRHFTHFIHILYVVAVRRETGFDWVSTKQVHQEPRSTQKTDAEVNEKHENDSNCKAE